MTIPAYVTQQDLDTYDAWEEAQPFGGPEDVWTDGSTIFCGTVPLVRDGNLGLCVTLDTAPSADPYVTRAQQALRWLLNDRCGEWTRHTPTTET